MARFLIDANLPRYFSLWKNSDFTFAVDLGPSVSDQDLWSHALKHEFTIVTKDADFADRVLLSDIGPSVNHLRVGNMKMRVLHDFLTRNWKELCRLSAGHRLVIVFEDRVECIS